jgi:hypothetical protein
VLKCIKGLSSGDRHWVQLKKDINTGLPKPCTRGRLTLHYRGTVNYKQVYLINNVRAHVVVLTMEVIKFKTSGNIFL